MQAASKQRLNAIVHCRVRVVLHDRRVFYGRLLAHDRHLNLVLGDCEERRQLSGRGAKRPREKSAEKEKDDAPKVTDAAASTEAPPEEVRTLGLVVFRGQNVVSLEPLGPSRSAGLPERFRKSSMAAAAAAPATSAVPATRGPAPPLPSALPANFAPAAIPLPPGMPAGLPPGVAPAGVAFAGMALPPGALPPGFPGA